MDILKSSQLVIFSHSTIVYNIFLQKSCRFSLQTLTKFEVVKTGSGVGFLRLTAVCPLPASDELFDEAADRNYRCSDEGSDRFNLVPRAHVPFGQHVLVLIKRHVGSGNEIGFE